MFWHSLSLPPSQSFSTPISWLFSNRWSQSPQCMCWRNLAVKWPRANKFSSRHSPLFFPARLLDAGMKRQAGIFQAGEDIKKLLLRLYFVNRDRSVGIRQPHKWKTPTVECNRGQNTSHWAAATEPPYHENMDRDQTTWTWPSATVAFNSLPQ